MSAQVFSLFIQFIIIIFRIMGSCLNKVDRRSLKKQETHQTRESASLHNLVRWKQDLNYIAPLNFDYPTETQHKSFRQIAKDVTRTFPTSPYFTIAKHTDFFVQVLRKIAVYYPKVGYTQGINFIVGLLLMEGQGKDFAFTMFTKIVTHPDLMCLGLYQDEFPLNRLYCALLWKIVQKMNPKIFGKIKSLNIIDEIWIFQWFMTFFIYSFPLQIVMEFLTFVFKNKKMALPRLGAAIILSLESQIMKIQNEFEIYQLLQNLKSINYWKKSLNENKILRIADQIAPGQVQALLFSINSLPSNKYWGYFTDKESNRSLKYLKFMESLKKDRKLFSENPAGSSFTRNDMEISILDSIEHQAIKRMSESLNEQVVEKMRASNIVKSKLWSSDLFSPDFHRFSTTEENT